MRERDSERQYRRPMRQLKKNQSLYFFSAFVLYQMARSRLDAVCVAHWPLLYRHGWFRVTWVWSGVVRIMCIVSSPLISLPVLSIMSSDAISG